VGVEAYKHEKVQFMKFFKMHGLGNDYIYFDCINNKYDTDQIIKNAVSLSHRNFGIGSDGVVLLLPSDKADVRMRMFNSLDGTEAEICGNAVRCISRLANRLGIMGDNGTVETIPGIVNAEIINDKVNSVKVKMFSPPKIVSDYETVESVDKTFSFIRVDVGNPHAVIFVSGIKDFEVKKYGQVIENNLKLFPNKTNVEFYEEAGRDVLSMRVWERGSGETLSCGTGACATAAAYRYKHNNNVDIVTVKMLGGDLRLIWEDGDFYMQGATSFVFEGEVELN